MADPGQLPPSIYQGLGWPQPDGTPVPMQPPTSLGPPADWGGLPPSVPQGLGWAPPPSAPSSDDSAPPPVPPPAPTPPSLPSMGAPPPPAAQSSNASATPDYQVPMNAFGGGQAPAQPAAPGAPATGSPPAAGRSAAPQRPRTFDQRMDQLQQRQDEAAAQAQQGIDAGLAAEHVKNMADKAAFQQYDQQAQANAAARQAENEQWAKIYATNEAKLDADRKQIESWKFNRNAYMDSLGVGEKVSYGIGAILAGIGNAMQGIKTGENPVIQQLQQQIHDANEAQMKERDNLVQKYGMDRQTGLDAQAYHATRQAELDKQDGLALTALSKKLEESAVTAADPMAQARAISASAQVKKEAAALLQSSIQLSSQHEMETKRIGLEGARLGEEKRHNLVQEGFERYKLDQEDQLKAAALLAKQQGKLSEDESKRALFIPGPDGKWQVARDSAGNPVLSAKAEEDRNTIGAADAYNTTVNEMIRGIKDHGGESGWFKSPEWQKMQSAYNSAVINLHKIYGVQSFRGEWTADMFKALASGGVDPTSFIYNAVPGLQESKALVSGQVNATLRKNGYDGPPVTWQDTSSSPVPTQTDEQKIASDAMLNPRRGFDKRPGKLATELGNFSARGQLGPNETIDTRLQQEGGILPSVRQALNTWGAALQSPDMAIRRHYYEQLQKIADESESPETAAYAQQLLERAQQQQLSAAPGAANAPEAQRGSAGAPR